MQKQSSRRSKRRSSGRSCRSKSSKRRSKRRSSRRSCRSKCSKRRSKEDPQEEVAINDELTDVKIIENPTKEKVKSENKLEEKDFKEKSLLK